MKIKFIKNIAVIIVDITKRPTEEDDKLLLETMELDYPYKIHILETVLPFLSLSRLHG